MYVNQYGAHLKVLVQGITRPLGTRAVARMQACGTQIVAGVDAGEGGTEVSGVPVFDLVEQATAAVDEEIDLALIFSDPYRVLDAGLEAIAAGIRQLVVVTAGVPPLDAIALLQRAEASHAQVFGPGSAGILVPECVLLGIHEPQFFRPGTVGVITCTDALAAVAARELSRAGYGQSIVVSLGSEAITGASYEHWLELLENDPTTEMVLLVSHAGSGDELAAAEYIASDVSKPVFAYLAGDRAPELGLPQSLPDSAAARLSLSPSEGTLADHIAALEQAGVKVARHLGQLPDLARQLLPPVSAQPGVLH